MAAAETESTAVCAGPGTARAIEAPGGAEGAAEGAVGVVVPGGSGVREVRPALLSVTLETAPAEDEA